MKRLKYINVKAKRITATSKGRILALGIFIFLLAVTGVGTWWWNSHKKEIVRNKIETAVRDKSDSLYNIKYDSLAMDEIAGNLFISNMKLSYDSIRYLDLEKAGTEPSILLNIYIPLIKVSGVETPRLLIHNQIVGRKLEIKDPVINILYTNSPHDSARVMPMKEIYEQLLNGLDLIQADSVLISSAQIVTSSRRTKKISIQIQDISIALMHLKVDSNSRTDTTRIFFSKEISITCRKLEWLSPNDLYKFRVDSISISSVSPQILVKNFQATPALSENAFVNALPGQELRYDLSFRDIQLQNVNLLQLFEQKFIADTMLIGAFDYKIYCDLAIKREKKNRIGTYLQQTLVKIPVALRVGKIILTNGFFEYKERNKVTRKSGKVQFYDIDASISNFTNDKKTIAVNNLMTADITSIFQDKTPCKINWIFYLLHPRGRFGVQGSFGAMGSASINSFAAPLGDIRIRKGKINGAVFNLHGDDYNLDGNLKLLYEDLRVTMLKRDKRLTGRQGKQLMSFLANIIIKNSNPNKNEDPRIIQLHLDRDPNYTMFNFLWKILLNGIRETVGIKS
jgi:hypothetical protein